MSAIDSMTISAPAQVTIVTDFLSRNGNNRSVGTGGGVWLVANTFTPQALATERETMLSG